MESACIVLGEEGADEGVESEGETRVLNAVLLFDLDGALEYEDWVTNLGCECDRRRGADEK